MLSSNIILFSDKQIFEVFFSDLQKAQKCPVKCSNFTITCRPAFVAIKKKIVK